MPIILAAMKFSVIRIFFLLLTLPVCAFAANNVVNLSHYDLMRPDFVAMKSEGIFGVIHEASYPRLERDAYYHDRHAAAARAGLPSRKPVSSGSAMPSSPGRRSARPAVRARGGGGAA